MTEKYTAHTEVLQNDQQPSGGLSGEIETRPTQPGEIGYTDDGFGRTALTKRLRHKQLGETQRLVGPAVTGDPDLDVYGNIFKQ